MNSYEQERTRYEAEVEAKLDAAKAAEKKARQMDRAAKLDIGFRCAAMCHDIDMKFWDVDVNIPEVFPPPPYSPPEEW